MHKTLALLITVLAAMVASTVPVYARHHHHHAHYIKHARTTDAPAGCPSLYCGCALSLRLFGRIIPELNASWNWPKKFARDVPQPGNVVFNWRKGGGHVALLLRQVAGSVWRVWDPNSGGHRTLVRDVNIHGRVVLNPRSSHLALR